MPTTVALTSRGWDSGLPWPPIRLGPITFRRDETATILAMFEENDFPPGGIRSGIEAWLVPLSAVVLFTRLSALEFHVDTVLTPSGETRTLGSADIRLVDPRHFVGIPQYPTYFFDIAQVRDLIIDLELTATDPTRQALLRSSPPLLYSLEHFIRAIVNPDYTLPELYKSIEAIENAIGGRRAFSRLGFSKRYVDLIARLANQPQVDQRHAPSGPSVSKPRASDVLECARRTRDIVAAYASSIPAAA